MDIFGRKKIKYLEGQLQQKNVELASYYEDKQLLRSLLSEKEKDLKRFYEEEAKRKAFEYLMNEKVPIEQNARNTYFSDITLFYRKIFKDKIAHMISGQKDALTIIGKTEREYEYFRACVNCFYLLDEWFYHGEREHLSTLEEKRQLVENSIGTVDEISRKYNK